MVVNNIVGKYVDLRSATVEDAEFALNIRRTPKAAKFMPPLDITLEQQKSWIEKQRATEGDYFFIVFNKNNERVGVISIYDIHENYAEAGRWVMIGEAWESIESKLLLFQFAFDSLGVQEIVDYIFPENIHSVRTTDFFGGKFDKIIYDEKRNLTFKRFITDKNDFKKIESQIMEILYNR